MVISEIAPLARGEVPFFSAVLPLPPGINSSYEIVRCKTKEGKWAHRLAATTELKAFKENATEILNGMPIEEFSRNTINTLQYVNRPGIKNKTPLLIEIAFFFKTMWKNDWDGNIKAVQDAVFSHLGLSDVTVTDANIKKRADRNNPRCEISVFWPGGPQW